MNKENSINSFKEMVNSNIESKLVRALILLFEDEGLFEYRLYDYARYVYQFKNKDFQDHIAIPIIKKFFMSKQIQKIFFDEVSIRKRSFKSLAVLRLFEIFLDNISLEEFEYYFKDCLEQFGVVLLNLMKKYSQLNLSSYWKSTFWFDFNGVYKKIGEYLSPIVKERIFRAIIHDDYEDLLFLLRTRLFHALDRPDAISIFSCSKLDFVGYIINLAKRDKIDLDEGVINLLWYFPLKLDVYVSVYIKRSITRLINSLDDEDIGILIRLGLHDYIDNELLDSLSEEGKIKFIQEFYDIYSWYNPDTIDDFFNHESRRSNVLVIAWKILKTETLNLFDTSLYSYLNTFVSRE